jgi:hypothetical protein
MSACRFVLCIYARCHPLFGAAPDSAAAAAMLALWTGDLDGMVGA